jgi:hypothetical protein
LIQQTQYTQSTPKYNFPQTALQDTALPTRFIELSLRSIRNIQNATETAALYQPYETINEDNLNPTEEITPAFHGQAKLKLNIVQLRPLKEDTPVVAVDVSSIRIGETNTGIIIAIRGAIIWKNKQQYRYLRIGPFPFHITEENKAEIYQLFRQYSLDANENSSPHTTGSAPNLLHMQARMTTLLERWLQMSIATQSRNSIILWDGSLVAGTSDSPTHIVTQLLETARNRLNAVLAFSKITRIRLSGHRLTDLVEKSTAPCLLEMDGYPVAPSNVIQFLGNVYVAKLTQGNCSFRLDVDRQLTHEQTIEAIQRLLANDRLSESYPETLRLAHIYSTFTANEVIAIKRLLAQMHGIKTVTRPNIRRLLFGPFGKGPEGG